MQWSALVEKPYVQSCKHMCCAVCSSYVYSPVCEHRSRTELSFSPDTWNAALPVGVLDCCCPACDTVNVLISMRPAAKQYIQQLQPRRLLKGVLKSEMGVLLLTACCFCRATAFLVSFQLQPATCHTAKVWLQILLSHP